VRTVLLATLILSCSTSAYGLSLGATSVHRRLTRELVMALDSVLAHERAGGGWTFASAAGTRPAPNTVPLKIAERLAAPLGLARWDLVVLRSPGTPAAGLALLGGYRASGRADYLAAAERAGDLLVAIQMPSGGWFSEMPVEGRALAPWFAWAVRRTAVDDDVTPGATRFLLALWEATGERRYRDSAVRAVAFLVRAQLPDGAWPLVWRPGWKRVLWPTFEDLPTLNDGATTQTIETLLVAGRTLGRADLVVAARRGGEWLLRARRSPPQAGWAQQYDADGVPAPARRFEPAALASWESRHAIDALLALAASTGDRRYCAPVEDAVRWLAGSAVHPGCWARFYALGTNAPLYVTSDGRHVDGPRAARSGYDWTGDFGIPALFARLGLDGDGNPYPTAALARRVLARGRAAPAERAPGDPGTCRNDHAAHTDFHMPDDARVLIAHAATLLAALEPAAPSPCVATIQAPEAGQ